MKIIRNSLVIITLFFILLFFSGCNMSSDENFSIEDKKTEEVLYIENKILTFYSMYAKKEYGEMEDLNWDLIEESVIDLNGVLDTVILDMSEIKISNEDIISFKDGVNRLSIATSNKDINAVLEEYRNLYFILPSYAQKSFRNQNDVKQLELKSQVVSSFVYSNLLDWEQATLGIEEAETKYKNILSYNPHHPSFPYI